MLCITTLRNKFVVIPRRLMYTANTIVDKFENDFKACEDIFCMTRMTMWVGFVPAKEEDVGMQNIDRMHCRYFQICRLYISL